MSNSEWKECPDWENQEDYAFLKGATAATWAWEFLRRNPDYRESWAKFLKLKEKLGPDWRLNDLAYEYDPPKRSDENKEQWITRIVANENGRYKDRDPIRELKSYREAKNWGLQQLYNPCQPKAKFLDPSRGFPCLITTADQFLNITEEFDTEDGDLVTGPANRYAVIAFDLTSSIEESVKRASKIIVKRRNEMLKEKKIPQEGHSNKTALWLRHLQVLDALRASPKPTHAKIAQKLSGNTTGRSGDKKNGEKLVAQARKMMRAGYRKALLYPGTPY